MALELAAATLEQEVKAPLEASPATTCPGSEDETELPEVCLFYQFQPGGAAVACPETQEVRMVLELKRAPYVLQPVLEEPEWLERGQLPCLAGRNGEDKRTELADMLAYLDRTYAPCGELGAKLPARGEKPVAEPWSEAQAAKFYQALTKYLKNTKEPKDEELRQALVAQCDALGAHLLDAGRPFLAGDQPGFPDCSMAPKLHILQVCAAKLKGFAPEHPELCAYMERVFALPAFLETQYEDEELLAPWIIARRRQTRRMSFDALVRGD